MLLVKIQQQLTHPENLVVTVKVIESRSLLRRNSPNVPLYTQVLTSPLHSLLQHHRGALRRQLLS